MSSIAALPITTIIFYCFAALLVASALMVILSKNPVQSALYLVLAFFASASLWIMMSAEFLGLILILVYVGAVMTLFLFVVMTVNLRHSKPLNYFFAIPVIIVVVGLIAAVIMKSIDPNHYIMPGNVDNILNIGSNTHQIGLILYTQYAYPFEIAGAILLVAIVAAIALSWKVDRNRKILDPAKQVATDPKSRLRIVKMASSKSQSNQANNEEPKND